MRKRSRFGDVPIVTTVASGVIVIAAVVLAVLGSAVTPYPFTEVSLTTRLLPPAFVAGGGQAHLLGTDSLGRDILSRLIVALRASLGVGFGGVIIACTLGTVVGLVAGYFRGIAENVLMTVVDIKLALPAVLLAIGVIAVFGTSLTVLVLVVGLGLWEGFARVVRSLVASIRSEDYVVAARAIGARQPRIVFRHILPNCVTAIIVLATLDLPRAIVLEASLSFLGIGIQAPQPSLGNMIVDGRQYLAVNAWQAALPCAALIMLTLSVSHLGDRIAAALDPTTSVGVVT